MTDGDGATPGEQPLQGGPRDFLTTYLAWCQGGTAPVCFHRWAGLSLLSASIQTRVQTARDDHRTSTLALYVMLVGGSGTGKGEAITRRALHVIGERHPAINPFAGQDTPTELGTGGFWHVPAGSEHRTACESGEDCLFYFHAAAAFDFTAVCEQG